MQEREDSAQPGLNFCPDKGPAPTAAGVAVVRHTARGQSRFIRLVLRPFLGEWLLPLGLWTGDPYTQNMVHGVAPAERTYMGLL